jgi:hypothetical protein
MKRAVLWVLGGVLALLLVAMLGLALMPWWYGRPKAIPHATPTNVADLTGDPFVSASPVQPRPPHRSGPAQPLVGAVFAPGDSTREMDLSGLPFTFVTAKSWGCLAGTVKVEAQAWRCIDEHGGNGRAQIDIVVRHCAAPGCTDAQRAELDTLLDHPATYRVRDPGTRYAEQTVNGRYVLTLNRVWADWQLLIEAEAAPGDSVAVQKIVNDIWAQTL